MIPRKICVALLLLFVSATAGSNSKSSPNETFVSTILEDICRAFQMVANNTNTSLNRIIPQMYNQSLTQQNDPMIVFQAEGKSGAIMLQMPRSDFMPPTFPNLTQEYMQQRSKQRTPPTTDDSWNAFGLDGWSGEISQPDSSQKTVTVYPIKEEETALATTGAVIEFSRNVYIARVNNPFGYSTKWQLRNDSKNLMLARPKRDVVELYSMIKCSTGCDPLLYKGYGCYCGFAGDGVPVDGIDRCCRIHDKCYDSARNCIAYLEYFVPYVWKCYFGKPLCAVDHGEWGGPLSCAARLCNCDAQLSRCLRQFICPTWSRPVCLSRFARLFKFH